VFSVLAAMPFPKADVGCYLQTSKTPQDFYESIYLNYFEWLTPACGGRDNEKQN